MPGNVSAQQGAWQCLARGKSEISVGECLRVCSKGRDSGLRVCYCSSECQKEDYVLHKGELVWRSDSLRRWPPHGPAASRPAQAVGKGGGGGGGAPGAAHAGQLPLAGGGGCCGGGGGRGDGGGGGGWASRR